MSVPVSSNFTPDDISVKDCFPSSTLDAKIRAGWFFLHLKALRVEGRRTSLAAD